MAPPLSAGLIMISLLFLSWLMEWRSVDVTLGLCCFCWVCCVLRSWYICEMYSVRLELSGGGGVNLL